MTILKPWPEHQNPTYRDRIASAPYNFVPLPEKIIYAVDNANDLPDHEKYYQEQKNANDLSDHKSEDFHSGYFDVTLTTRSPLYIPGPLSAKAFSDQSRNRQEKNKD